MKNILIVDDEKSLLKSISISLSKSKYDFKIFTAVNGSLALETLKNQKIDLLITDLQMPVMDGFELITHMVNNYNDIPMIVMTAYGTPKIEKQLKDLGVVSYLEKPFDIKDFRNKIIEGLSKNKDKIAGYISDISIPSFLQLVQMEKMTYTIKIISDEKIGFFYFINGNLLNAKTYKKEGTEAFNEIIHWTNVRLELKKTCANKERVIKTSLTHLILKAMQIKDEKKNIENEEVIDKKKKEDKKKQIKKERKMDIQKLQESIKNFMQSLGDGLKATDVWSVIDAQSLASYNGNPVAVALFDQITNHMITTLKESNFPSLGKYFILELVEDNIIIVVPLGEYRWGMLIDKTKIQLGLILNVILPKSLAQIKEALR